VPGKQRFVFGHGWAKSVNSICLATIAPDNVTKNKEARKFIINTFYREAVVLPILGLVRNRTVTDRELDKYMGSRFSISMHSKASNELAGCWLSTSWNRDHHYAVVEDVTMSLWHNTAAEIAMEKNPKHPGVRLFV
jgi:hypothetical protein